MVGQHRARIEVASRWHPEDYAAVATALLEHNRPFLGAPDHQRLAVTARRHGRLQGAIYGESGRGMVHFDLVWVAAEARGQGIGRALVMAALDEGRRRGCRGAWLDTFDFQARGFYEKLGFQQFAELEGFANDHRRFFMVKHF
ncbi:Acetyltransferase (GNAT) family protein [Arboricoccus pini]|uniref:Acetyltransferase (GNAT) family protein n=1 Tax=Arboricoccus pini TaxID=1963835 RepID=A0A212QW89_9PROT|nr:GNAT family N-acetyltransferase [Arboricoccus pini]SNB63982.1 Acetyltransferase (GNAT) family protein [Arboricoccus pini]